MQRKIGWTLLLTSIGGFLALMAQELHGVNEWHQLTTTDFVGKVFGHLAVLLIGIAGGNQVPTVMAGNGEKK